ncbi:hypothetical protein DM01DRAFT_348229 [Hesseltinella vesiculosa]|uniref:Fanconi-associated nuclease n=1 Tax=Hesseltinella vesiculosa TaxID=101127 RepID=A0A1X2GHZ2_9FUNG|nr:hypothetical protein DM01DRAFT_348229 [Hesseltinella vesiculosa]
MKRSRTGSEGKSQAKKNAGSKESKIQQRLDSFFRSPVSKDIANLNSRNESPCEPSPSLKKQRQSKPIAPKLKPSSNSSHCVLPAVLSSASRPCTTALPRAESTDSSEPDPQDNVIDSHAINRYPKEDEIDSDSSDLVTPGSLSTQTTPRQHTETSDDASESNQTSVPAFYETSMYTDLADLMIQTLLDQEAFLFTQEDQAGCRKYLSMDAEPKHLLVRLWMRQRKWLRLGKLDYGKNINDMDTAASTLIDLGLAHGNDDLTWEDAMDLMTVDDLKQRAMDLCLDHRQKTVLIGSCIKLREDMHELFQRLSLVFFRLRDPTETNPMQTAILAKINRRHYPEYIHCRTTNVWPTKEDLDLYTQAFALQRDFEAKVERTTMELRRTIKRKAKQDDASGSITPTMDPEEYESWMACWTMCENIVGQWEELLTATMINPAFTDEARPYYMRRFEAGYIYTHMLEHGCNVLARMHEYDLEATILRKLLDQRRYRMAKRGKWYDRLALVQSNYLKHLPERQRKKMALKTCIDGVQDPRVHQMHMYRLHRRIHRLERDLCIPRREQHDFSYMALSKPQERDIFGTLDRLWLAEILTSLLCTYLGERISDSITGIKSSWRGDDGAVISVEQVAIQYYNKQGYQGLHAENGVISMLFALLFWDIIFAPIPGAFETPYQTAPLDIGTDAFYIERVSLIHDREELISQDIRAALDLIKTNDDLQRPLNTMCAGVNWNYEQKDLLEVAECIGSHALACLCRLLAEEYGCRQGGMPDLCCWDVTNKKSLLVEVKGPSDTLSETQKLWLHTLSNMGIPVEVCHVKVWKEDDILLEE